MPWFKEQLLAFFKGWRMRKILRHPKIVKLHKEVKDMLRLVIEAENPKDESED